MPVSSAPIDRPAAGPGLERRHLTLGYVPLTDSAPLVVALERGFFEDQGLHVTLSREGSWAGVRDKVAFGVLDAAPMTAPMPLAATLGAGGPRRATLTALVLSRHGNGITLSTALADAADHARRPDDPPRSAHGLARVVAQRRAAGQAPLRLGVVFGVSTHHYELRSWLADAGIDPDRDVEIRVVPPPRMADALAAGELDGYCVGAPWNAVAQDAGLGRTVLHKHQHWPGAAEKVLGVNRSWARAHPGAHAALLRALAQACRWLQDADHRESAAALLARPDRLALNPDVLRRDLLTRGPSGWALDFGPAGHRPQPHEAWEMLGALLRWGHLDTAVDFREVADAVWSKPLHDAALSTDLPTNPTPNAPTAPAAPPRTPAQIIDHLFRQPLHRCVVDRAALDALNPA